jgi:proline dehydrogenase
MLTFDNTEIAFASKTDSELENSYWLFKLVASPALVSIGEKLTHLSLALRLPIQPLIKATIFKQFCGGETIEQCNQTILQLSKFRIGTILDYSIEGKETENDFDATMHETVKTIHRAKGEKYIPFSVFKVTGLARFSLLEKANDGLEQLTAAEKEEYNRVYNRVDTICKEAFNANVPIFIDAEDSWIQNSIDRLANAMMEKYNKHRPLVYNTYQLYRHDRLEYLKNSFKHALENNYFLGAKLVRGAYMEKERARAQKMGYADPIQPNKEATDRDYNLALEFCIENIHHIGLCAGTHNEQSCLKLAELLNKFGIEKSHPNVYFSQLYGMSDHISYNLAYNGYNVAKYVPYGPVNEVLPYLIRRAKENTSVKGQTGRELSLIIKEKQRRKQLINTVNK